MTNFSTSLFALATFSLAAAPSLLAQTPVQIRCALADGRATGCYYCPGYEFVIKFVGTQLQSPTVNLNLFQNQHVLLTGTWNGSVVTVSAAQTIAESFSITGNGSIGNRFRFNTIAAPGDLAMNLAALGTAFLVPFADLAVMVNPASMVVMGLGTANGNGEFKSDLDIPNDPTLVGLRLFGQGVVAAPTGALYTTNLDAKEVTS